MEHKRLNTYEDFTGLLDSAGMMTLSANKAGLPDVSSMTAQEQWHTGLDTDPWQWKTRVVEERRAAYAKVFGGMPSFVTQDWYPLLLAARRGGGTFEEAWESGLVSAEARRIYSLFGERRVLAVHEIKAMAGLKGSAGKYEQAMRALQESMWITVSGMTRMATASGRPHSWPVTEYTPVEDWAWPGVMEQAMGLEQREVAERLIAHGQRLNPQAGRAALARFLTGRHIID